MTQDVLEKPKYPDVDVQLVGEDGNAFAILGICQRAARQQGVSAEEVKAFMQEAMAGDYNHLLVTCQKWFAVC
jgi:hypothetical protein